MQVKLLYTYIRHDIDQWTYRLAQTRLQDPAVKSEAQSSDISTDNSFYIRKIEDAVAHLFAHMNEELIGDSADADDTLDVNAASWIFDFKADTKVSLDSQAVANLFHRFVVFHVVRDWAVAYAPDSVQAAAAMFTEAQEALDEGLYSLKAPVKHRRPHYCSQGHDSAIEGTTVSIQEKS